MLTHSHLRQLQQKTVEILTRANITLTEDERATIKIAELDWAKWNGQGWSWS